MHLRLETPARISPIHALQMTGGRSDSHTCTALDSRPLPSLFFHAQDLTLLEPAPYRGSTRSGLAAGARELGHARARCQAAGLDFSAQRPQLARSQHGRHAGAMDRLSQPRRQRRQAACPLDAIQRCTRSPATVSAWSALECDGLLATHTAPAGHGLFGAGRGLPRLWQEQPGPALAGLGRRGCPCRLGLAGPTGRRQAALYLRPLAGRRRCYRSGQLRQG